MNTNMNELPAGASFCPFCETEQIRTVSQQAPPRKRRAFLAGEAAIFDPKTEEIEARYNWKNIVKRFGELIDG